MATNPEERPPGPQYPPPTYPPPQYPPPTGPPAGGPIYSAPKQPVVNPWQPQLTAPRPSPLWGLTVPAAVLAFPLGLVAVYFSSQVNTHLQRGDLTAASKASGQAKAWGIVMLVLAVIVILASIGTGGY